MALQRKSIINWNTFADGAYAPGTRTPVVAPVLESLNNVGDSEPPLSVGFWKHKVWRLPKLSVRAGVQGLFDVPPEYVSAPVLKIRWSTILGGGGSAVFVFEHGCVSGDGVDSYDRNFAVQSLSIVAGAPQHRFQRTVETIILDDGCFVPGADIQYGLFRNGPDGADSLVQDTLLFGAYFEFSDV